MDQAGNWSSRHGSTAHLIQWGQEHTVNIGQKELLTWCRHAAVLCMFSWKPAAARQHTRIQRVTIHTVMRDCHGQLADAPYGCLWEARCFLTCCQLHWITNLEFALWTIAFGMMRLHQVSAITTFKPERSARHLTTPPTLLPRSYLWIKEWCYHCAATPTLGQCPDTAVLQRKPPSLSQTFQIPPRAFCYRPEVIQLNTTELLHFCFVFKGNYNLIKYTGFVPSVMQLSLPLSRSLATEALSSFLGVLCTTLSCHPTANLITVGPLESVSMWFQGKLNLPMEL